MLEPFGQPDPPNLLALKDRVTVRDEAQVHPGQKLRERIEAGERVGVQPPTGPIALEVVVKPDVGFGIGQTDVERRSEVPGAGAPLSGKVQSACEVGVIMLLLECVPERGRGRAVAGRERAADPVEVKQDARRDRSPVLEQGVVQVEQHQPRRRCRTFGTSGRGKHQRSGRKPTRS